MKTKSTKDTRPVRIVVEDEGRFGRINEVRKSWAPLGSRPVAPSQIVREYVYAFAAICPELGKMSSMILPRSDTEMMNIFLQEVGKEFQESFVIMLLDQASWHFSGNLKIPENIRIVPLPAYSPELNPVEHLWKELREKKFHNKACDSLDEVENELCEGLKELMEQPDKLRSMTFFEYLNVTI